MTCNRFLMTSADASHIDELKEQGIWAFPRSKRNESLQGRIRNNVVRGSRVIFYVSKSGAGEESPYFCHPSIITTEPGSVSDDHIRKAFGDGYQLGFQLELQPAKRLLTELEYAKLDILKDRPRWIDVLRGKPNQVGTPVPEEGWQLFDELWDWLMHNISGRREISDGNSR